MNKDLVENLKKLVSTIEKSEELTNVKILEELAMISSRLESIERRLQSLELYKPNVGSLNPWPGKPLIMNSYDPNIHKCTAP